MTVSWDRETRTVARRPWWKTKASLWRDLEAEKARYDRYAAGQKELNDRLLADIGDLARKVTERDHGIAAVEMQKRELARDRDKWALTAEELRCTLVHRDSVNTGLHDSSKLLHNQIRDLRDELREMTAERDALAAVSEPLYWQCDSLNECTRRAHDAQAWRRSQAETLHPTHTPSSLVAHVELADYDVGQAEEGAA